MCSERMMVVKSSAGRASCEASTQPQLLISSLCAPARVMAGETNTTKGSTVLVVSTDPVIGGIVGLLVELSEHRPVFDDGRELPEAALTRHLPHLVLVDVEHRDGFSPEFIAHAEREGVRVVAFGHRDPVGEIERRAAECGVRHVLMPPDLDIFRRTLTEALSASP